MPSGPRFALVFACLLCASVLRSFNKECGVHLLIDISRGFDDAQEQDGLAA
jgi:hypothetical protein